MVKVPLSNSFLERRDARRKFSESLGRLPGTTHSSADLTWIRKWLEIQAPELSELESVELELGCCCSDLDEQVSDEICRTRKRQFEIPFRLWAASCPRVTSSLEPGPTLVDMVTTGFHHINNGWAWFEARVTSCSIPPGRLSRKRRRTDRKDFYHVPQHHKP